MLDIAIIVTFLTAVTSIVFSVYALKTQRDLRVAIHAINDAQAASNESQQMLLNKVRGLDDWLYSVSDRSIRSEHQLMSLKRLVDIENATHLAEHMKVESKRYADLSKDYQAWAKNLKKGVQS